MIKCLEITKMNDGKIELNLGKNEDIISLYEAFIHDIKNDAYDLKVEKNTVHGKNIGLLVDWENKYIMLINASQCVQMITEAYSIVEL